MTNPIDRVAEAIQLKLNKTLPADLAREVAQAAIEAMSPVHTFKCKTMAGAPATLLVQYLGSGHMIEYKQGGSVETVDCHKTMFTITAAQDGNIIEGRTGNLIPKWMVDAQARRRRGAFIRSEHTAFLEGWGIDASTIEGDWCE